MAISKVDFYGDTLIDISSDTVDAEHLAEGYTAHDAAGNAVLGTMSSSSGSNVVVTPDLVDGTKIATITVDDVDSDIYAPKMTILSYGNSTWNDFITAYNSNSIVYCRASSNSNPASGSQTRLAFMAYVNNANAPTEVEFQYYRSVSSHTATQQGDQVYVYKLNKTNGWSVITREAMSKIAAGSNMSSSYANGTLTLNASSQLPSVTSSDNGKVLMVENGVWSSEELLAPIANGGTGADNAPDALENLGAVPLAGGTMTGDLLLDTHRVKTLANSIERYNPGSSSIYGGSSGFQVCDKNGEQIGYIQPVQNSDGRETMQMGVSFNNGSSTDYNSIDIGFDANGNKIYGVSSASAFRNAIGIGGAYGTYFGVASTLSLTTTAQKVALKTFNGTNCSASSNGIKIAQAGTYLVWVGTGAASGFTAGDRFHVRLYKNSTFTGYEAAMLVHAANAWVSVSNGPFIVSCAANDVLYVYAYNESGSRGQVANSTQADSCGLVILRIA